MKLLITGFDPFGGEAINPALEAVKLLPDTNSWCTDRESRDPHCIWEISGDRRREN